MKIDANKAWRGSGRKKGNRFKENSYKGAPGGTDKKVTNFSYARIMKTFFKENFASEAYKTALTGRKTTRKQELKALKIQGLQARRE